MIYEISVRKLVENGSINLDDSVLVVCGGRFDREVLSEAGFTNVTISNLDTENGGYVSPFKWDRQDAEHLTYENESFDIVLVHAGLHHCYSPHRALGEMLRVAKKAVLVFEARDSLLLNFARKLGFTMDYEIESVSGTPDMASGGVAHTGVPNFIYRWTEKEVLKTVRTADPRYEPSVKFFYNLLLPHERFEKTSRPLMRYTLLALTPILELIGRIVPKQSNEFGFLVEKTKRLHPWLESTNSGIRLSQEFAKRTGRVYQKAAPDAPRWQ